MAEVIHAKMVQYEIIVVSVLSYKTDFRESGKGGHYTMTMGINLKTTDNP
jgi:hypothetical protein